MPRAGRPDAGLGAAQKPLLHRRGVVQRFGKHSSIFGISATWRSESVPWVKICWGEPFLLCLWLEGSSRVPFCFLAKLHPFVLRAVTLFSHGAVAISKNLGKHANAFIGPAKVLK
jgi:hypothetical protein